MATLPCHAMAQNSTPLHKSIKVLFNTCVICETLLARRFSLVYGSQLSFLKLHSTRFHSAFIHQTAVWQKQIVSAKFLFCFSNQSNIKQTKNKTRDYHRHHDGSGFFVNPAQISMSTPSSPDQVKALAFNQIRELEVRLPFCSR